MSDFKYFALRCEPQGKGRPRFYRRGNYVGTYTPEKTVDYEAEVKKAYCQQCKGVFEKGVPIEVTVRAFFRPPKSTSKCKLDKMIDKKIRPTKKPDLDNVAKAIADALNGVAYHDDAQIVALHVEKFYDIYPRIEVELRGEE